MVGKWIDSKPIYQKTISFTTDTGTTISQTIPHGVSNIDKVVGLDGFFIYEPPNTYYFGFMGFANTGTNQYFSAFASKENIYIRANEPGGSYYGGRPAYFTLRYTKTTD